MAHSDDPTRRYRSGEAAKLANMPAATLRVWEQRYGVVSPPTSASGQRLYADEDIDRLKLLKTLVGYGYSIGSIARLTYAELEDLLRSPRGSTTTTRDHGEHRPTIVAVGFEGRDLTRQASEFSQAANVAYFDNLIDLGSATLDEHESCGLLINVPALHEETVRAIAEAAELIHARDVMIVFPFGTQRASALARLEGMTLRKSPSGIVHIAELLDEFGSILRSPRPDTVRSAGLWSRSQSRFDDATLARLANLSTTIACECPKHIVDLVTQLRAFERYSDECVSRSPEDALLHRHLGDTANRAFRMFEDALVAVIAQEGWDINVPPDKATS